MPSMASHDRQTDPTKIGQLPNKTRMKSVEMHECQFWWEEVHLKELKKCIV